MSGFFYRLAWSLARPAAALAPGGSKLARAARGRAAGAAAIAAWARDHRTDAPLAWFHGASVGEGRQAEAVLRAVKAARPAWQMLYTYASPSAVAFARTLPADFAGYLPADHVRDTTGALEAARPSVLVFAATDLWPELVRQAAARGVRLALVAAMLAQASSRRSALARAFLGPAYAALDLVGAVDHEDAERLVALGVPQGRIEVTGDSRHDSAAARAAAVDLAAPHLVALGAPSPPLVVAGSTWPTDEAVLVRAAAGAAARTPLRLVIAPHEPDARNLTRLDATLQSAWPTARTARLSALESGTGAPWDVCVVDRVGVLADLYARAAVAFVGGGFHDRGLHSVIEPAAHGVPVLFGPSWRSSRDARLLLEAHGALAADAADLGPALARWLGDATARADAGRAARGVVDRGRGAAARSAELVVGIVESG